MYVYLCTWNNALLPRWLLRRGTGKEGIKLNVEESRVIDRSGLLRRGLVEMVRMRICGLKLLMEVLLLWGGLLHMGLRRAMLGTGEVSEGRDAESRGLLRDVMLLLLLMQKSLLLVSLLLLQFLLLLLLE